MKGKDDDVQRLPNAPRNRDRLADRNRDSSNVFSPADLVRTESNADARSGSDILLVGRLQTYTYGDSVPRAIGQPKIRWCVGIPGSGKTFLAYQYAKEDSLVNKRPVLVINSADTDDFNDLPRIDRKNGGIRKACELIWREKKSCQYVPDDTGEVDALIRASLDPGRINLVVDEAHYWVTARGTSTQSPLTKLCRAYRHGAVGVYFTTQHFSGDIPSEMVSCAPEFYVFRSTAPAVLDRLERAHGLDRAEVRALPARRFIFLFEGFAS